MPVISSSSSTFSKIPVKLSSFLKQVLSFSSSHMWTLWNNRLITARKPLFTRNWFESGILFVTDLLDSNGALLDYVSFLKRHNLDCPLKDTRKVCHAIPLAQLLCNTLLHSNIKPTLPSFKIGNFNLNDSTISLLE